MNLYYLKKNVYEVEENVLSNIWIPIVATDNWRIALRKAMQCRKAAKQNGFDFQYRVKRRAQ